MPITQYSPRLPISCLFIDLLLKINSLTYWTELLSGSHVKSLYLFSILVNLLFFSWQAKYILAISNSYTSLYCGSLKLVYCQLTVSLIFFSCLFLFYFIFAPFPKMMLAFQFFWTSLLLIMLWFIFSFQICFTVIIFT